jgi:cytidylate kinase
MENNDLITIDGPAGSGKSTLARQLAKDINWTYLDTGAIYRTLAILAQEKEISVHDPLETENLALNLDIRFLPSPEINKVFLGEREVTNCIRNPEISKLAAIISSHPNVRTALLAIQRRLGQNGNLVAEGRDTGTVIFPLAKLKFFLSASPEVRAQRRYQDNLVSGFHDDFQKVLKELKDRDETDQNKPVGSLKKPVGAICIEASFLGLEQVLTIMKKEVKRIFGIF